MPHPLMNSTHTHTHIHTHIHTQHSSGPCLHPHAPPPHHTLSPLIYPHPYAPPTHTHLVPTPLSSPTRPPPPITPCPPSLPCSQRAPGPTPLGKEVTAELGNVTPYIVVPGGNWSQADMDYQVSSIVAGKAHNCGHCCIGLEVGGGGGRGEQGGDLEWPVRGAV